MFFNLFLITKKWNDLKKLSLKYALIYTSIGQQLYFCLPSVGSLRILLSGWLLACLVLRSSYSGCLHSLMAFPSRIKTIDTVKELANAQKNGEIQTITESKKFYQSLEVKKKLNQIFKYLSDLIRLLFEFVFINLYLEINQILH
jgi:hypothetical protein